jgi:uncharacterized NAD(P)/FAD-binding protein YdhS
MARPTVAIVGAGFSGVLTALNLLKAPDGPCIRLIEKRAQFAQGAAYATTNPDHFLNVRAANMSAFPDDPTHFIEALRQAGQTVDAGTFVTRASYGAYLQGLLRAVASSEQAAGRLILEADGAVDLHPHHGRWRVEMAMGRHFNVDAVVLALGNLPPHPPGTMSQAALESGLYIADPWSWRPEDAPETGRIVLLGTGLTMIDVALGLAGARPDVEMMALSRRGLMPRRHTLSAAPPTPPSRPPSTVRQIFHDLRAQARTGDWRPAIDGLRPHVQAIWRDWSHVERTRFLRHLRPWWDVHRHRLAPPVAERIDHLTAAGRLTTGAGRIAAIDSSADGLKLVWTARGRREPIETAAALVVNCTGPNSNLAASTDPLIASLSRQGLIRPDPYKLGAEVNPEHQLIGADGRATPSLYAVGPMTRGSVWEITSVPDIRVQAAQCAAGLVTRAALRVG